MTIPQCTTRCAAAGGGRPGDHPGDGPARRRPTLPRGDQSAAQAGRTAGLMLGRMTPRPGEVLMVSGRQDYSAHRLRIQGFPRGAEPALSPPAAQRRAGGVRSGGGRSPACWNKPCAAAGILLGSITPGLAIPRLPRRWPATAAKATSAGSPMSVTTPPGSSWRRGVWR